LSRLESNKIVFVLAGPPWALLGNTTPLLTYSSPEEDTLLSTPSVSQSRRSGSCLCPLATPLVVSCFIVKNRDSVTRLCCVNRRNDEVERMGRKTRKLMTISWSLHLKAAVDRLYISRKKGGRGLMSIEDTVHTEEQSLNQYIDTSEEEFLRWQQQRRMCCDSWSCNIWNKKRSYSRDGCRSLLPKSII